MCVNTCQPAHLPRLDVCLGKEGDVGRTRAVVHHLWLMQPVPGVAAVGAGSSGVAGRQLAG